LGQRRLTISHSPRLEAVASHHPELRMIQGQIYLFHFFAGKFELKKEKAAKNMLLLG
jgi:hypothetical protein